MSDNNKIHINLAGKNISVIDDGSQKMCSYKELAKHIRKFKTYESLNSIGKLSYKLRHDIPMGEAKIGTTPVDPSILSFLSLMLIRHSNDYRGKELNDSGLEKAVRMYINLKDAIYSDGDGVSYLLRYGSAHWDYFRPLRYALPRTYLLYSELWSLQSMAKSISIDKALNEISGLYLRPLLLLAFAFSSQAKNGHVIKYSSKELASCQTAFAEQDQDAFFEFLSCDYGRVRDICDQHKTVDGYEKYIFNPLIKFPFIIPDKKPYELSTKPYIVPVPQLLINRVTHGLYYDLADKFMGKNGENAFKVAFGYVLQDYIGKLLFETLPRENIVPEFKYTSGKDTPDWMVIDDKGLVVIEVKQSATYLNSKQSGKKEDLLRNLKNTLGKAAIQLAKFDEAVREDSYETLSRFRGLAVQRLIVTYDSTYFLNSFIKDYSNEILHEEQRQTPSDFDYQIISIDDFEMLISACEGNLFSFLETKNSTEQHKVMDFREYLALVATKESCRNAYLEKVNDDFFNTVKQQ